MSQGRFPASRLRRSVEIRSRLLKPFKKGDLAFGVFTPADQQNFRPGPLDWRPRRPLADFQ